MDYVHGIAKLFIHAVLICLLITANESVVVVLLFLRDYLRVIVFQSRIVSGLILG